MFWKKYKKTPGRPSKKPREKHLKKDLARLDYRHLNFRLKNKCEQKCTPGGPKGLLPAVDSKKGTEKFSSLGAVTQPRHCTLRLMGTIPKSSRSWQKMVPAKRTSEVSRRIHDKSPLTSDFEYVGYTMEQTAVERIKNHLERPFVGMIVHLVFTLKPCARFVLSSDPR